MLAGRRPSLERAAASSALRAEMIGSLSLLRVLLAFYVVYLDLDRLDRFARPGVAVAAVVVVLGWTAFTAGAYRSRLRRTVWLPLADLTVTIALVLLSIVSHGPVMQAANGPTLVSYWACVPVLMIAASWGAVPAFTAAVAVSAADLAYRVDVTAGVLRTLMLLLIASVVLGLGARLVDRAAGVEIEAQRQAAAFAERTRVYRDIHDGVLQALALTHRIAGAHAADHPDLAAVAGEARTQEQALRELMARSEAVDGSLVVPAPIDEEAPAAVDLAAALAALTTGRAEVELATPAGETLVPSAVAAELIAAVGEALANVAEHAGPGVRTWLLLEDDPSGVTVSVRDDGPGIPVGRLDEAERTGHRGVAHSIRGRLADLGGAARLHTGAGGTEWELHVPRARLEGL
ncbi:DUF5931 domain-containing protein [Nocardioides sp. TRM66260-LWL]|uniref:MacS family sensor histidine kinase n=1 Tax=Nocardioides sp. TRM66260-LWL TaxID=2874478 RepID=UPI001CC42DB8|nr:DUF5931 domain-containing protein [Nocardioides sp. TRM66260-LWL]MBZ5734019.1 DUF5931 domain-containing protein [Nocardioides sp. TRM66260-LWL]